MPLLSLRSSHLLQSQPKLPPGIIGTTNITAATITITVRITAIIIAAMPVAITATAIMATIITIIINTKD